MIVRIKFDGIVADGEKKSTITDAVDIHTPEDGLVWAKTLFLKWTAANTGIKGNSGVIHPLGGYGDIKIKEVKELKEDKPKKEKQNGK